jgi:hypothetical protein
MRAKKFEPAKAKHKRSSELREERFNNLLESCQQEVLRQIIGPFGLTPAMFNDVDGGAVTTLHNFEQGITATASDQARFENFKSKSEGPIDRSAFDEALPALRKEMFQKPDPIISAYTGRELPRDGRTHLDHVVSVKSIETDPKANLFMDEGQRVAMANHPNNLVPSESDINQSMQDKDKLEWAQADRARDPGKTNAESLKVDMDSLKGTRSRGKEHVESSEQKAQFHKQAGELLKTGAEMAARNALRHAFGVLLHAFVSGSFSEIKTLLKEKGSEENLIDRLIASLKRVMKRVVDKLKDAFHALLDGGVQGFISNFLTYLINCIVTTSAKVVTIIREGLKGLWKAIKLMLNPPMGMQAIEVAREASKIIAAVITTAIGMLLQESVKGFISSIPILLPMADMISPVITGIITGVMTALVVYGLDQLFDWLSSKGTEMLATFEANLDAQAEAVDRLEVWLKEQYRNSEMYSFAFAEYYRIHSTLEIAACYVDSTVMHLEGTTGSRESIIGVFHDQSRRKSELQSKLDELLTD